MAAAPTNAVATSATTSCAGVPPAYTAISSPAATASTMPTATAPSVLACR
ncbi:hypothetical protein [Saccharopolyspora gregorii]